MTVTFCCLLMNFNPSLFLQLARREYVSQTRSPQGASLTPSTNPYDSAVIKAENDRKVAEYEKKPKEPWVVMIRCGDMVGFRDLLKRKLVSSDDFHTFLDDCRYNCLGFAIFSQSSEAVRAICENGWDVEADCFCGEKDGYTWSRCPLGLALWRASSLGLIQILLEYGADCNSKKSLQSDGGGGVRQFTPFALLQPSHQEEAYDFELYHLLVRHGGRINSPCMFRDNIGSFTPIGLVISHSKMSYPVVFKTKLVVALIQAGASPTQEFKTESRKSKMISPEKFAKKKGLIKEWKEALEIARVSSHVTASPSYAAAAPLQNRLPRTTESGNDVDDSFSKPQSKNDKVSYVKTWSIDNVCEHFAKLGWSNVSALRTEFVDGEALLLLSDDQLKELGVPLGVRAKHSKWIKENSN